MDLSCRTSGSLHELLFICDLVEITAHLGGGAAAAQQLFSSPQMVKAYVSAMASWVKACILQLTRPAAGGVTAGVWAETAAAAASESSSELEPITLTAEKLLRVMGSIIPAPHEGSSGEDNISPDAAAAAGVWGQAYSTIQLVLLWWLSHAVAAVSKLLLEASQQREAARTDPASSSSSTPTSTSAAVEASGSSSSRNSAVRSHSSNKGLEDVSSSSGPEGGSSSSSGRHLADGRSSSSSSSSSSRLGKIGAEITDEAGRNSSGLLGSGVGSSGSYGGAGISSSGSGPDGIGGLSSTVLSGSWISSLMALAEDCAPQLVWDFDRAMAFAAKLGVMLLKSLVQWHAKAQQQHQPGEAAAGASEALQHSQGEVGGGTPTAAAAAACGDVRQLLPKRMMMMMPQQGLPDAVILLMEHKLDGWSGCRGGDEGVKEFRLQVLRDVVELCQVLQQEVPCPLGCNNPRCVDLKGVSEVVASCKTCTGCGVARYCSRECQVGHWKEHRRACRRLEKGYNG